jgi:hypothetical protein
MAFQSAKVTKQEGLMFEVFFFVNPLGTLCYHNEQTVISVLNEQQLSASYHLVPVVSMANIQTDLRRRGCSSCLQQFNQTAAAMKQAQTDFYALKMLVGNKKARRFIFNLQAKLSQQATFSQMLVDQLLHQLGINPALLANQFCQQTVEKAIQHDQQLTEQFGIQTTPTTVIYNYEKNQTGHIFEGAISRADLDKVLTVNHSSSIHLL